MRNDTPPSSIHGDDEIPDQDIEEEEMIYLGDIDEVIEIAENEQSMESDVEEEEDNVVDNAKLVFSKHEKSVFSVSVHPNGKSIVTGGEDDKAYVWNVETGEVELECAEHSDSIIIASFSFDGNYLITADMSGFLQVRKCPTEFKSSWDIVWTNQIDDMSWGFWHFAAHVFIGGAVSGEIYIWKIPSGETKVLQSHGSSSSAGVLTRDGRRLGVVYDDTTIKIWDLKAANCLYNIKPNLEEESHFVSIDSYHDNNLIVTGSSNGNILIIKSTNGMVIGNLKCDSNIECIKFSKDPSLGLFAIGSLDGFLMIWDVARQTLRHKYNVSENGSNAGITHILWVDKYVVAGCLNGNIIIFDSRSGELKQTLTGHKAAILDITYFSSANILISTSDDGTCRIFDTVIATR